jgi:hypothetical protein
MDLIRKAMKNLRIKKLKLVNLLYGDLLMLF